MNDPMKQFKDFLKSKDVEYQADVSFREISYLKLGGICDTVVYPKSSDELCVLLSEAISLGIPYKVIGRMSNILPPDNVYQGVLISTRRLTSVFCDEDKVFAECGVSLPYLSAYLARRGISCIEELSGIPGTLGAAIYMNAGAYGLEISDVLEGVVAFDSKTGEIRKIKLCDLKFSYRHSSIMGSGICVILAVLRGVKKDSSVIFARIKELSSKRRQSQPLTFPSLGSVFKKADGVSAAFLIDRAGLKGYRIGGAAVSDKHAGFIVNLGNATADDYLKLVKLVKTSVYEKFGVLLEEEIEIL